MFLNRVEQRRNGHALMADLPTKDFDCAEISGAYWIRAYNWKSAQSLNYPVFDICAGAFRDALGQLLEFDMIIADQVWEHLDRPYAATCAVYEMLRPGGYFYIATPFFARFHAYPVDCSRWTARGLRNLLMECGFKEEFIHSDQWGNLNAARRDCARRWAKYEPGRDDLANDPTFPIAAWALGRKAP